MWVVDLATKKFVNRDVTIVPGLFKIFDEILVNAADNKQRDSSMDKLEVNISQDANTVSVWYNGASIPVHVHAEHHVYVPELIFGHLLTSSNYDDDEKKGTALPPCVTVCAGVGTSTSRNVPLVVRRTGVHRACPCFCVPICD